MDDLVFRSTDNTKWGPGKDSKLTIAEGDGNLWAIQKAVTNLETNPPTAVSIANFIVVGSQFQVVLTNGATLGPFQLPFASFRFRKEGYVDGGTYNELDIVPVPSRGLFMVQVAFTADGPFDPFATNDDGDQLFLQLFGTDLTIYDVEVSITDLPGTGITDGEPIFMRIMPRNVCWLASEIALSVCKVLTAPADGDLVIPVNKNDEEIGSITIADGETSATLALDADVQFAIGDILSFMKPSAVDSAAKNLVATLALRTGLLADFGITA